MTTGRIDTHHHIVPPMWADALGASGYFGGQATPAWSPAAALELLDELGIDTAVVSVGRPGVHLGGTDAAARALARQVNEFAADLVREHPGRFGFFASVPLPDVDGSLAEVGYALDELNADGVILLANVDGTYLGDPAFDPLMTELDRRGTVVFVHPTAPPGPAVPGVPAFSADFLLDTTRAALNLVRHGVVARLPRLRMILSHAGGFVPYAAHRMASLTEGAAGHVVTRENFLRDLRTFYFDTALSANPHTLPSLLSFADPDRVLYGSDWPYARGDNAQYFTAQLDAYPLTETQRTAINRDNALALLPRVANVSATSFS
ncbi:amidohydrolase [Saccharopolyspora sp. K220]|uniref:amidohydrolase family protein n=1 Tax=Saccharopolyspora soli TaxID=2926618 RepID=UPI001F59861C|nr:amidohydrolase family protein [Saccharopolyspora soli]MCI2417360.1 amidohydrolase [Saccharopolyspora soli]